jgi:hypothetical protein
MAKDQNKTAVVPDLATLRSLRDALDAPAQARVEAEAREREAEQRTRQDGVLKYARRIVDDLQPAVTAWTAWTATLATVPPMGGPLRERRFGPDVLQALDRGIGAGTSVEDLAGLVPAVERVAAELAGPALLPPARVDAALKQLDAWAGRAASYPGLELGWTRQRREAEQLMAETREALAAREAWMRPPPEALAALEAHQQRLATAAGVSAARPYTPLPQRRVGGANLDAVQPPASRRAPLLENLEDLE